MNADRSSTDEVLNRRIRLLGELAGSLERAQAALLRSDIQQMNLQTARQQEICQELQSVAGVPGFGKARECSDALRGELDRIAEEVARLNVTYGALLRRARRTVDIFCRILANSQITYLAPKPQTAPARSNTYR